MCLKDPRITSECGGREVASSSLFTIYECTCYSRRKQLQKTNLVASESGSSIMQDVGGPSLFEEALHQAHTQGLDGVALPDSSY